MEMNHFQNSLFYQVKPSVELSLCTSLKNILENKHLYQNIRVEFPDKSELTQEMQKIIPDTSATKLISDTVESVYSILPNIEWRIVTPLEKRQIMFSIDSENFYAPFFLTPPDVKLYCHICKRKEAYNYLFGKDLLGKFRNPDSINEPINIQIFILVYQCQSCKSTPEIFLLRRENFKLIQSGRSPMEELEINPCIPKDQKKYFSQALIAFNSGQVLAGNFLLRTFTEQFVRHRSITPDSQNIEELFNNYSKELPDDFKVRFRSLKSIYDLLSEDIHYARASEEVFLQSISDIERYFEAVRVYKLE